MTIGRTCASQQMGIQLVYIRDKYPFKNSLQFTVNYTAHFQLKKGLQSLLKIVKY